jgi:hypothetical protein
MRKIKGSSPTNASRGGDVLTSGRVASVADRAFDVWSKPIESATCRIDRPGEALLMARVFVDTILFSAMRCVTASAAGTTQHQALLEGSGNCLVPLSTEQYDYARRVRSSPMMTVKKAPAPVSAPREVDILRRTIAAIEQRLSPDWSLHLLPSAKDLDVDRLIELTSQDRQRALLVVDVSRVLLNRDLPAVLARLASAAKDLGADATPLVVARYLDTAIRSRLEEQRVSYADATGNMFLRVSRPTLFLRDRGADRDPWRGPGRPLGNLQGPPAARVVRTLVDYEPPQSPTELTRLSGTSTGATYRAMDFLEQAGLIERDPRGPVRTVHWRRLIQRWSEDYGFQRSNSVGGLLAPRGLDGLLRSLAGVRDRKYVVTGSLAAHRFAPYADARLAMVYVDDVEDAAERLGLRHVDVGANVLLAAGDYDIVFERAIEDRRILYAAPSQTAVDLLTSPGRGPSEANALLDWMEANESDWRRRPPRRRAQRAP